MGSVVTHYCDWAISVLIQPASFSRQPPLWETLSWLHAGSALFSVAGLLPLLLPPPLPQSTSECIHLHLYCSRLKAIVAPVQGGQRVSHLLIQRLLKIFPLWCCRDATSPRHPACIKRVHGAFEMYLATLPVLCRKAQWRELLFACLKIGSILVEDLDLMTTVFCRLSPMFPVCAQSRRDEFHPPCKALI